MRGAGWAGARGGTCRQPSGPVGNLLAHCDGHMASPTCIYLPCTLCTAFELKKKKRKTLFRGGSRISEGGGGVQVTFVNWVGYMSRTVGRPMSTNGTEISALMRT